MSSEPPKVGPPLSKCFIVRALCKSSCIRAARCVPSAAAHPPRPPRDPIGVLRHHALNRSCGREEKRGDERRREKKREEEKEAKRLVKANDDDGDVAMGVSDDEDGGDPLNVS